MNEALSAYTGVLICWDNAFFSHQHQFQNGGQEIKFKNIKTTVEVSAFNCRESQMVSMQSIGWVFYATSGLLHK